MRLPPGFQDIDDKITGDFGGGEIEKQLIPLRQKNTIGGEGCGRLKVMVTSFGLDPIFASSGKWSHLDRRFRIQGKS